MDDSGGISEATIGLAGMGSAAAAKDLEGLRRDADVTLDPSFSAIVDCSA